MPLFRRVQTNRKGYVMHRTIRPGFNKEDPPTTADIFLRIIGNAMPELAEKEKVAMMMTTLDIITKVPMKEVLNLRNAMHDFQQMTVSDKEEVRSTMRRKLTELKIGT